MCGALVQNTKKHATNSYKNKIYFQNSSVKYQKIGHESKKQFSGNKKDLIFDSFSCRPSRFQIVLMGLFLCECMGANNNDIARLIIDITPVRWSCFMVFQNVAGSQNT